MIANLIDDLTVLTDVSDKVLKKFIPVSNYVVGHAVHEAQCVKDNYLEVDIGIGELHIKINTDSLQYRFVPSKELEKVLIQTVTTGKSPMVIKLNNDLQEKIEQTYKELI